MKGIILAGGSGTRLSPMTDVVNKQILPVYNKPLIFYPLSTLMLAGIREIMIISTPKYVPIFQELLGNGDRFGVRLTYAAQEHEEGIPQAFVIGERFIDKKPVCLCLGDNIFHGSNLKSILSSSTKIQRGAHVYAYHVHDPQRYGVVSFDKKGNPIKIEEKPKDANSNWALTGLYFYDQHVVEYAKNLKKSARGEFEITDIHKIYMSQNKLTVNKLGQGINWIDAGTFDALLEASNLVASLERKQRLKISDPYEIAQHKKWV